MKCLLFTTLSMLFFLSLVAQDNPTKDKGKKTIYSLIDQYSEARDKQDTILLKRILTNDVDQLVSSGEWRMGIGEAVKGMLQSSLGNPGSRKLIVDKVRFLDANNGIADARYEIQNPDGTIRKMWSTFFVVNQKGNWKIAGIRNMLPTASR